MSIYFKARLGVEKHAINGIVLHQASTACQQPIETHKNISQPDSNTFLGDRTSTTPTSLIGRPSVSRTKKSSWSSVESLPRLAKDAELGG